jgi:DNA ligase 1
MKLPTLYSKRENGGLQEWTIEVGAVSGEYRTIAGKVGCKMQTSKWTICKGKNIGKRNETMGGKQALKEAQARWDKRVELGDREKITDLGNDGIFFPMLANRYEDYKDELVYPVYCQPKLDGIRVIARKSGLWSRNGKRIVSLPHIEKEYKPIFARYPDLVIDGEGYADKLKNDFNKVCSLIKKTKPTPKDLKESAEKIQHYVYDCKYDDCGTIFSIRNATINELLRGFNTVHLVETTFITDQDRLDKLYGEYLEAGYEGQIVRTDTAYENKRCKALLKRKEFKDAEFTILAVVEGTGNRAGMAGHMEILLPNGKTGHSNIKGNQTWCRQLLKDAKGLVGKKVTVKFFNWTEAGVPRFPFVIKIHSEGY